MFFKEHVSLYIAIYIYLALVRSSFLIEHCQLRVPADRLLLELPPPEALTLVWAANWGPAGTTCTCNPAPLQRVWEAEPAHGGRVATSCRLTAREWSGVILARGGTSGWLSPRAQLPRHADDISAKCDVFLGCMHFFFFPPPSWKCNLCLLSCF